MTRDEHSAEIQRLIGMINPDHQADATQILTGLSDDYEEMLTASETLTTENATLKGNNEKLRSVNAELFLKVGTTNKETHKEEPANNNNNGEEIPTFESLFNENGVLK